MKKKRRKNKRFFKREKKRKVEHVVIPNSTKKIDFLCLFSPSISRLALELVKRKSMFIILFFFCFSFLLYLVILQRPKESNVVFSM